MAGTPLPSVTVVVLTHNHERFAERCIRSILDQRCDYPLSVIVADDASSDDTPRLLQKIADADPRVTVLLAERNLGILKNIKRIPGEKLGTYIALLDGDDYWSFDEKLQRQVSFLESRPEYNACFHDVAIRKVDEGPIDFKDAFGTYSEIHRYDPGKDYTPEDAISRKIIPTGSLVFRRSALEPGFLANITQNYSIAWALTLSIIKNSRFKYFPECWGVYTQHRGGITKVTDGTRFILANIAVLSALEKDSFYRLYRKALLGSILREYRYLFAREEYAKFSPARKLKFRFLYTRTRLARQYGTNRS